MVETFARKLSTQGFKILLDIVSTAGQSLRVAELPYQFRSRHRGASKLDTRIALDYAGLVLAKATSDLLSLRFIFFCLVGMVGIGVHFVVLSIGVALIGLSFPWAQTLAIVVAIANNFALNNAITYRDQRLTGVNYLTGLLTVLPDLEHRRAVQHERRQLAVRPRADLVGRRSRRRGHERGVELRDLVDDGLAQPLKSRRIKRSPAPSAAPRCAR